MSEELKEVPEEAIIPQEELDLSLESTNEKLDDTEDVEVIMTETKKVEKFARDVLARTKKVEEENRELKKKLNSTPVASPQLNVEETILLANGMSEELLGELRAVAQVRKVSLIKAQTDPIFVAVKEKFEKDQKHKEASLGVSRGSGSVKPKMDFNTPNLPRETHKELFYKAME
jgi:hypothetical protein